MNEPTQPTPQAVEQSSNAAIVVMFEACLAHIDTLADAVKQLTAERDEDNPETHCQVCGTGLRYCGPQDPVTHVPAIECPLCKTAAERDALREELNKSTAEVKRLTAERDEAKRLTTALQADLDRLGKCTLRSGELPEDAEVRIKKAEAERDALREERDKLDHHLGEVMSGEHEAHNQIDALREAVRAKDEALRQARKRLSHLRPPVMVEGSADDVLDCAIVEDMNAIDAALSQPVATEQPQTRKEGEAQCQETMNLEAGSTSSLSPAAHESDPREAAQPVATEPEKDMSELFKRQDEIFAEHERQEAYNRGVLNRPQGPCLCHICEKVRIRRAQPVATDAIYDDTGGPKTVFVGETEMKLATDGREEKLRVKRCDYVNCCGDVNGCNGIYCDNPKWQWMTPDEYREYFQKEPRSAIAATKEGK